MKGGSMSPLKKASLGAGMAGMALLLMCLSAGAQPGWGPGMMMGPGMMGSGGFGFMCNPRVAGFAEWRMDRIESAVQPTEAQRAALNELRSASTKAAEIITASCPPNPPAKSIERLELMEKRAEAMLQAVKVVRPAFEAFYALLDNEQKSRLDATGPRRWGWHGWRWGSGER
jgi:hypothetical protein